LQELVQTAGAVAADLGRAPERGPTQRQFFDPPDLSRAADKYD
jgi:hypothetical protein